MCRMYVRAGAHTVVATPHMLHPDFDVPAGAVRDAVRDLQDACRREGIDIEILPGAELRLEPGLLSAVEEQKVLSLADGARFLLVELPYQLVPPIEDLIFELALRKKIVIIAHPERNMELARRPGRLEQLVGAGCLAQVTLKSMLGKPGRMARKAARRFLERDLVHMIGTDAHRAWPVGRLRDQLAYVTGLVGVEKAGELLFENPMRILKGERIEAHVGAGSR